MSYNISSCKILALHLELPLTFDFQHWLTTQPDVDEEGLKNIGKSWYIHANEYQICASEQGWGLDLNGTLLSGIVQLKPDIRNSTLLMDNLEMEGEFSGYNFTDIIVPLFKEFNGVLDAILVWEGGDKLEHVSIKNGEVGIVNIEQLIYSRKE